MHAKTCRNPQCLVRKLQHQIYICDYDFVCSTCLPFSFSVIDLCPAGFTQWFFELKSKPYTTSEQNAHRGLVVLFCHNSWWGKDALRKKKRQHYVLTLGKWLDDQKIQHILIQNSKVWDILFLESLVCTKKRSTCSVYLKSVIFTSKKQLRLFQDLTCQITFDECYLPDEFALALIHLVPSRRFRFVRCSFSPRLLKSVRKFEHFCAKEKKKRHVLWSANVFFCLSMPKTIFHLVMEYVFWNEPKIANRTSFITEWEQGE